MNKKLIIVASIAALIPLGATRLVASAPVDITVNSQDRTITNNVYDSSDVVATSDSSYTTPIVGQTIGVNSGSNPVSGSNYAALTVNGIYKGTPNTVYVSNTVQTLNAYYVADNHYLLMRVNSSNHIVDVKSVASTYTLTADDVSNTATVPTGYAASGYVMGNGTTASSGTPIASFASNNAVVLTAKFSVDNTITYDVSAYGATATVKTADTTEASSISASYDENVTAVSSSDNFRHWEIGDKIVSYDKSYTFAVYSDVLIKEITSTTSETAIPTINLYHENNGVLSAYDVAGYTLPTGYTAIEAGIGYGGTTYSGFSKKIVATKIDANNQFAVKTPTDTDYSGLGNKAAYLIYSNGSNTKVIYDTGSSYDQFVFTGLSGTDSLDKTALEGCITETTNLNFYSTYGINSSNKALKITASGANFSIITNENIKQVNIIGHSSSDSTAFSFDLNGATVSFSGTSNTLQTVSSSQFLNGNVIKNLTLHSGTSNYLGYIEEIEVIYDESSTRQNLYIWDFPDASRDDPQWWVSVSKDSGVTYDGSNKQIQLYWIYYDSNEKKNLYVCSIPEGMNYCYVYRVNKDGSSVWNHSGETKMTTNQGYLYEWLKISFNGNI